MALDRVDDLLFPVVGSGSAAWSDGTCAFQLSTVHQPARRWIESVAAVHGAAIVPPHQIAGLPLLRTGELLLDRVRPQLVEELLALRHRQPDDIGVDAAAEEQRFLAGLRMRAHHRLPRSRDLADILDLLE